MLSQLSTTIELVSSVMTGPASRRLALAAVVVFLGSPKTSLALYSFLTVTGNGIGGNAATSQFTGTNGVINVTHAFSPGGAGGADNNNALLTPSQFTTLFPGTGIVKGHLAQTVYGPPGGVHTSDVTFDFAGYTLTPNTVFGIWNTTTELAQPFTYKVTVIDGSNNPQAPSTFNLIGNQDNTGFGQPAGKHQLVMNAAGEILTGAQINAGGTHTNAAFWDNLILGTGTTKIVVHGNLTPLNTIGDGVGYYFAELVIPEPTSVAILAIGVISVGMFSGRRRW